MQQCWGTYNRAAALFDAISHHQSFRGVAMRQHYDGCCHASAEATDRFCRNMLPHKQITHRVSRFAPRRSVKQNRRVNCSTAVERVGHQTDVLIEPPFPGHLKLSSGPAARLFPEATEGVEGIPLNTIINRRIKGATVLPQLLEVIVERGRDFNHANTSHALNRLAKLYRDYGKPKRGEARASPEARQAVVAEYVEPAVTALTLLTLRKLPDYEPWDVATSLWAAAILKLSNTELVDSLLEKAEQLADTFMPADVSNVIWACAKLQLRPQRLLKHLVPVSVEQMQLFKPHEVAVLVWSYAKVDFHPGNYLLEAVADHVVHNIHLFPAQESSNVLWSMARFKYRHDAALQCLEQHLLQQKNLLNPQDISNTLWACAKVRFHSEDLFQEFGSLALHKLAFFKPQELTNVVYAHAVVQHRNELLLEAAAGAVTARMPEFSCQELVNVLWAFARLKYFPSKPQCLSSIVNTLVANRVSLSPQALANLVKSLAKLSYQPDPLTLDVLANCSISCISQFKPAEVTNLLWAYATLGVHNQNLFDAAIAHMQVLLTSRRRPITTQHINSVLYSCEAFGFCPRGLVDLAEAQGIRNLRTRRTAPRTLPMPAEQAAPSTSNVTSSSSSSTSNRTSHVRYGLSRRNSTGRLATPSQNQQSTTHTSSSQTGYTDVHIDDRPSISAMDGHAGFHVSSPNGFSNSWAFTDFGISPVETDGSDRIAHVDFYARELQGYPCSSSNIVTNGMNANGVNAAGLNGPSLTAYAPSISSNSFSSSLQNGSDVGGGTSSSGDGGLGNRLTTAYPAVGHHRSAVTEIGTELGATLLPGHHINGLVNGLANGTANGEVIDELASGVVEQKATTT